MFRGMEIVIAISCLALGAVIGLLWSRSSSASLRERVKSADARITELSQERDALTDQLIDARQESAVLETELTNANKTKAGDDALLLARFEELSQKTLSTTGHALVAPVQQNLDRLEAYLHKSEKQRQEHFGGLFEQMRNVAASNNEVKTEAAALKNVLRSSSASRGRWGEVQLKRVVELAGMLEHADFAEQVTASDDSGVSRADLVVYLPGNVQIAVDAKVPYSAYEQAQLSDDVAIQKRLFVEHARQFKAHVDSLAQRAYWEKYVPSAGFTVLFVPGEALLDAALAHDTGLWERAAEKHILLATPSTLIALLRMATLGWKQEAQTANAAEITAVGKELHKRLIKAMTDVDKVGKGLRSAMVSYNDFVGSVESRVLPQARRLSDLGASSGNLTLFGKVDEEPRVRRALIEDREMNEELLDLEEPRKLPESS